MKLLLSLLFIGSSMIAFGQRSKGPNFDIADFNQKMKVAEWLYDYDMVAWQTTDSVMTQDKKELERLGSEWFCFQQDDTWHAVYGKYENHIFDLVFHYTVDSRRAIRKSSDPVDTSLLHRYSRALQTAGNQLKALSDTVNLRFNQYIRENGDSTFTVWILPAFQPNNIAVYGGEFIYTIDPTGTEVLKDDSYFQGNFRGFKVDKPREIWIDYPETGKPSLGAIFFAWYYKAYFTKIVINNANSISTPIQSDNTWTWIHALKESMNKKGK